MDIGESTIGGGGPPPPPEDGGGGGGGGCRFSRDGMLRASGKADMPGNEALLEHPDEPNDEHDEVLFLDWDTGDGVPSV